jgi:hypothetical protein
MITEGKGLVKEEVLFLKISMFGLASVVEIGAQSLIIQFY